MLTPEQAHIHQFKVVPSLPEPLKPLLEIANNLWWAWHPEAIDLFNRLDRKLWNDCGHNPIQLLGSVPQDRLEEIAKDDGYLANLQRIHNKLTQYIKGESWFHRQKKDEKCLIAYFSAEFGMTESVQIYSGGLGILAGDHLKSASELGIPLIGIGLLYRRGYFQQYLNADGWQQEFYPDLDFENLPVKPILDDNGDQITVSVDLPGRCVHIAVWEIAVGRTRLLLLDTNVPQNDPADRGITFQLYGGDMEMRIKQEIVLGIGGTRALIACDLKPTVMHMNEGHAAFMALERIRHCIEKYNVTFDEARTACGSGNLFTTHTPVPAGIDRFPPEMIQRYFEDYCGNLRLNMEGLLALGRENVFNKNEFFSMAVLALRTSAASNGVSKLHGEISRKMWSGIWPGVPYNEVPIGHVTNGVHARSWFSSQLTYLFDRYLPMRWKTHQEDQTVWEDISNIPDEELWRTHEERRQQLVTWVRERTQNNLKRRGASTAEIQQAGEILDPRALTIGFARRFATYKRANLFFRDPNRLLKLLKDTDRPLQLIVAGKAHPADTQGKELIRQIIHFARDNNVQHRIVFIENYDINVARYLVTGVDVWLNTPRRGMEASGTSGMKAAINGVLNLSILDGWWDEAHAKDIGWAIGGGEPYVNYDYQDQVESQALLDLLENQVVPLFYNREKDNLPRQWIKWMNTCMKTLIPEFNTNRMVQQYAEQYYLPLHHRNRDLNADNLTQALKLEQYNKQLDHNWDKLRVHSIDADTKHPVGVRKQLPIATSIHLGELQPEDVKIQIYYGPVDSDGKIQRGNTVDMTHVKDLGKGLHQFEGNLTVTNSGRHGFAIRAIPGNGMLATPFLPGKIMWDRQTPAAQHHKKDTIHAT